MKYLTLLFFILISSLTTAQKKDIIDFQKPSPVPSKTPNRTNTSKLTPKDHPDKYRQTGPDPSMAQVQTSGTDCFLENMWPTALPESPID